MDKPNEYTYIDAETKCQVTLVFAEKRDPRIAYGIADMLFDIYLRKYGMEGLDNEEGTLPTQNIDE